MAMRQFSQTGRLDFTRRSVIPLFAQRDFRQLDLLRRWVLRSMAAPRDLFPYFRTLSDLSEIDRSAFSWSEFFPVEQPVELDIGCGRGMFLFNSTESTPATNFLGIEIDYKE